MASLIHYSFVLVIIIGYSWTLVFAGGDHQSIVEECLKEYPVTNGKEIYEYFTKNGEIPDESDKNAKCQFYCMPKKVGMVDENGVLDTAKAKELFIKYHPDFYDLSRVDDVMKSCTNDISDICDKMYQYKKCMMKEYLKHKNSR